jgi:hypothetical protein
MADRKPSIKTVLNIYKGPVVIREQTKMVELFHHSLCEHLYDLLDLIQPTQRLAADALKYILYEDFSTPSKDTASIEQR